jgi:hypothetical protein
MMPPIVQEFVKLRRRIGGLLIFIDLIYRVDHRTALPHKLIDGLEVERFDSLGRSVENAEFSTPGIR